MAVLIAAPGEWEAFSARCDGVIGEAVRIGGIFFRAFARHAATATTRLRCASASAKFLINNRFNKEKCCIALSKHKLPTVNVKFDFSFFHKAQDHGFLR
jgi:hypothetical protein